MGAQNFQEILDQGMAGGHTVHPASVDLGDDIVVIMCRHPKSDYALDGSVCILNSRLTCDEKFQQRFRQRIRELNHCITDDMEAAGMDLAALAVAWFAVAVDTGHIDPYQGPLTKAVKLSELERWAASSISDNLYTRYIDGQKLAKCGSEQPFGRDDTVR